MDDMLRFIYTECLKNRKKISDLSVIVPSLNPFKAREVGVQSYFDYFAIPNKGR